MPDKVFLYFRNRFPSVCRPFFKSFCLLKDNFRLLRIFETGVTNSISKLYFLVKSIFSKFSIGFSQKGFFVFIAKKGCVPKSFASFLLQNAVTLVHKVSRALDALHYFGLTCLKFCGIVFDRLEEIDSGEDNICFFLVR